MVCLAEGVTLRRRVFRRVQIVGILPGPSGRGIAGGDGLFARLVDSPQTQRAVYLSVPIGELWTPL